MPGETQYCVGPGKDGSPGECGRDVFRGEHCETHVKQLQRHPNRPLTPISEKVDSEERYWRELWQLVAIPDDPECHHEFEAQKRKVEAAAKAHFGKGSKGADEAAHDLVELQKKRSTAIRRGLKRRRMKGLPLGRPRKLDRATAANAVQQAGSIRAAAARLGVKRETVRSALNAPGRKTKVNRPPTKRRPHIGRGSTQLSLFEVF